MHTYLYTRHVLGYILHIKNILGKGNGVRPWIQSRLQFPGTWSTRLWNTEGLWNTNVRVYA